MSGLDYTQSTIYDFLPLGGDTPPKQEPKNEKVNTHTSLS